MKTGLFTLIVATVLGTAAAIAQDEDVVYYYCSLTDSSHDTAYFSAVFSAPEGWGSRYSNDFTSYVHSTYGDVIGTADCPFETDQSYARDMMDQTRTDRSAVYGNLIETGWSP
jgi:hypothetical protein